MLLLARGRRLYLVIAAVIGFYILPTVYYGYFRSARERVEYTFTGSGESQPIELFGRTYTLETSAATRVRQWRRIATEFLPNHPFIGKGVTAVGLVDAQVPRVIGETGLIGFGFWAWLMWGLLVRVRRIYTLSEDPLAQGLAFGFFAAYVGMLVQSMAVNTFIIIRIMEPFWFTAALLMRYYQDKIAPLLVEPRGGRRAALTARAA
jgi:hypothetical protein